MCGINGIYFMKGPAPENADGLLHAMNQRIAHRGPDDEGQWTSAGRSLFLGHRRLSIIDLSEGGHQPMRDAAGNAIVYNGEIYNYRELRGLLDKDQVLKSQSDTEILLSLYAKKGHDALQHLNGMFAFAFWDEQKETLFLARDRAGKKPLYYTEQDGIFSFSSEIKSLLCLPWVKAEPDEVSIYHFLTYNQLPPALTMFKGIRKLAPGTCMTVQRGQIRVQSYWEVSPSDWRNKGEEELSEIVLNSLKKSVAYRMVSDVPVGAFLSGGVDSSAVVACMRAQSQGVIKTYSVGFEGAPGYDERHYAAEVSRLFHTEHHEKTITASDIAESLPLIIESFDEPMADATCIPIFFISKLAREKGTIVVQTGDGADEIFAGYRSWMKYQKLYPYYHAYRHLPSFMKKAISSLVSETHDEASAGREIFARAAHDQELFWGGARAFKESAKRQFLSDSFQHITAGLNSYDVIRGYREGFEGLKQKSPWLSDTDWMCYLGLKFQIPSKYLYRMDRLGMANSIEIRSPFLDYELINTAFSIPPAYKTKNNEPKYILKHSLEKILPHEILFRKKMGFCVPLQEWAGEIMLDYTEQNLKSFVRNTGIFTEEGLKTLIREIRKGNAAYTNQLWTIYFMMAWFKRWMSA
ncbi:MAG: asparagine synthase (glutamine-hydrolyzing) [Bacteroidia bacterium]|nr:asparagine synthase (glutamine-hydrolyzing) [Bacteroidia bacterium]